MAGLDHTDIIDFASGSGLLSPDLALLAPCETRHRMGPTRPVAGLDP